MLRRLTCAAWAICAVSSAAVAENPFKSSGPTPTEKKALALIEKLAAADFRERETAARDLAALGDRARPVMKRVAATTDNPEVERRLEVLIAKLEHAELHNPRRVTFTGNKPIGQLLKEIADQTGYKVNGGPDDEKQRLTVAWKDRTFWEALDEVAEAAGLSVQANDYGEEAGGVSVHANDSFDPHVHRAGPFRVVATNIGSNQNRLLSGLPRKGLPVVNNGTLTLNLMLLSEPKNPMLGAQPVVVTAATDDTGASLLAGDDPNTRVSYYNSANYRGNNQYLYVNLGKPAREATLIKELRGKVQLTLLAGTRPEITVEKLLTVKKKTFVSRTTELLIESVTEPSEAGFSVTLTAKHLHATHEDYAWSNAVYQRLEVYDEDGEKFVTTGATNMNQAPGSVSMTLPFVPPAGRKLGKPTKLVLVEWITAPREVEFSFKNVPLP
jgi:hypothetical protein